MSSMTINTVIDGDEYILTVGITPTDGIPTNIFSYENSGEGLGTYQAVCTLDEYKRFQTYSGTPIPVFGNKFIKWSQAVIRVPLSRPLQPVIDKVAGDLRVFIASFNAAQDTNQTIVL